MYETLPYFSGRSTLEGVYNQASLTTHSIYYLASELGATSPNPFRDIDYGRFDTAAAIDLLRLFAVSDVVALSPKLVSALEGRPGVTLVERVEPYSIFRLGDGRASYVEPVHAVPVRSPRKGWRDKALRWFTRRPLPAAPLVFTDDARVGVPETDSWLPAPETPIGADVRVEETLEAESVTIRTSRPGHPLLVKIAWHPRWRAEGALGPYLAAPALMLVVPQQETVRLSYARTASDRWGWIATAGALVVGALVALRRRRPAPVTASVPAPVACADDLPAAPRRWGGLIPAALVLLLFGARLLYTPRDRTTEARALYELASKAYAEERYPDAAEYARHAASRGQGTPLRDEMLCLRGESLLRAGQPQLAVEAFQTLLQDAPGSPYAAQALFSGAVARESAGDEPGARADRARLLSEHAGTPWARRLEPDRN
jgi:hypothetical protein